ncbi:MAG TPA: PEGA domain-containing protein [Polyangiaceae bacterium]|nr:PEGA domain-containing protein [Polyangiaceae bacterium]
MKRALASLVMTLALLLPPRPSVAQSAQDIERAKASFKAGANAYAAGDYLAAIQALETAYELSPLPAIAFSLAQAERKQYFIKQERPHLVRALELFRRYLQQEPQGARREDALSAIALLEPLLGAKPDPSQAPAKVQARPTRLMIASEVPGALISLDGGQLAPSPLIREVTPGKHRARIVARGFHDVERDVTAVAGELILTEVKLTERPSTLYLWAPEGAEVYIDGSYVAHGGPRLTLPLSVGRHQLAVGEKGKRLVRREIAVERGKTNMQVVQLQATAQRNLSELLFIGGGAALGAGVALSAFAIRSENRAEDFLWRRKWRKVQTAELVAYEASVSERNRYRTAAAVSIAGSLGLFITGLFLHELDHPNFASPRPRELPARSPERTGSHPVQFSPTADAADVGASFQVNF